MCKTILTAKRNIGKQNDGNFLAASRVTARVFPAWEELGIAQCTYVLV